MAREVTRREFVRQVAVAAAGVALGARRSLGSPDAGPAAVLREPRAAAHGEGEGLPIVDTHQHLWDLDRFRLPWTDGVEPLRRNYVVDDYLEAARGLNIVKAVYMEVDVEPSQQVAEAEYVTELCRRGDTPTVAAVISGRPASEDFAAYVDRFRENAYIKGIRQVLHGSDTPAGYCLQAEFIRGIRLLGEVGMSYDICIRPAELPDAARLIDACPGTRFILDHCGNGDVQAEDLSDWRRDIAAVAERENVVCKVSGIVASADPERWTPDDLAAIVNHVLGVFGPARVMFGGDWPVCTLVASLREWVAALQEIVSERPEDEQRRLFHDNAVAFYGLE